MIIFSYGLIEETHVRSHQPKVAVLGESNSIIEMLGVEPEVTIL